MRQFNITPEHLDQQRENGVTAMIDDYLVTLDSKKRTNALPRTNPYMVDSDSAHRWLDHYVGGLRRSNLGRAYSQEEKEDTDRHIRGLSYFDYETGKTGRWWQPRSELDDPHRENGIRAMPHDLPVLTGALAVGMFNRYRPIFKYPEEFGYPNLLMMARHVSAATVLRAEQKQPGLVWWQRDMNSVPLETDGPDTRGLEVGFIDDGELLTIRKTRSYTGGAYVPVGDKDKVGVEFSPYSIDAQVCIGSSQAAPKMVAQVIGLLQYAGLDHTQQKELVRHAIHDAYTQSGATYGVALYGEVAVILAGEIESDIQEYIESLEVVPITPKPGTFHGDADKHSARLVCHSVMDANSGWSDSFTRVRYDRDQDTGEPILRISQGIAADGGFFVKEDMRLSISDAKGLLTGLLLANQRTSSDASPEIIPGILEQYYGLKYPVNFDDIPRFRG